MCSLPSNTPFQTPARGSPVGLCANAPQATASTTSVHATSRNIAAPRILADKSISIFFTESPSEARTACAFLKHLFRRKVYSANKRRRRVDYGFLKKRKYLACAITVFRESQKVTSPPSPVSHHSRKPTRSKIYKRSNLSIRCAATPPEAANRAAERRIPTSSLQKRRVRPIRAVDPWDLISKSSTGSPSPQRCAHWQAAPTASSVLRHCSSR